MHADHAGIWPSGTAIVQEEYWLRQLVTVRPVTVVEDSARLLVLYSHAGSVCRSGAMRDRRRVPLDERLRVYLSDEQPVLEERPVRGNVLTLTRTDAHHSVWLFWDWGWRFGGWYVNLQPPIQRHAGGVCVADHLLDLTVTPDLRWAWKDEDEFEAVCAAGVFSDEQRARIRDEGKRMAGRIERREAPFDADWSKWRPDPAWPPPAIPRDWRPHGPPRVGRSQRPRRR